MGNCDAHNAAVERSLADPKLSSRRISIEIRTQDEFLLMSVEDEGAGFVAWDCVDQQVGSFGGSWLEPLKSRSIGHWVKNVALNAFSVRKLRAITLSLLVILSVSACWSGGREVELTRAEAVAGGEPIKGSEIQVELQESPFRLILRQGERVLLDSGEGASLPVEPGATENLADIDELTNPADLLEANGVLDLGGRYGSLGFAVDVRWHAQTPLASYGLHPQVPVRWFHATRAEKLAENHYRVLTDDPLGRNFDLKIVAVAGGGLAIETELNDAAGVTASGWSFERTEDERYLGFGERSEASDLTGRLVENWAEEGPFSGSLLRPVSTILLGDDWQGPHPVPGTNFPMPWFLSSKGYGFLLDSFAYSAYRLNRPGEWNVAARDHRLRVVVFPGPTPAKALQQFTEYNGRQPEPAEWFFGPWYQPLGDAEFRRGLIPGWRDMDVPVTVAQTYAHYLPCASQFGRRDALQQEVKLYHQYGYRVTTYVNSFVCTDHPGGAYDEGVDKAYFLRDFRGEPYPVPYVAYTDASSVVVDFTNPDAATWWQGLITEALEDGYDGWMEDFGEYVPPDAYLYDGRRGLEHHNEYCTIYHRVSDQLTRPIKGKDFAQFIRCGNIGTAPYARIVWGADPSEDDSQADGLAGAIAQGLSMGLSGIAYWGSDIGGFHSLFTGSRTSADTLIRWIQMGAFSGIMRMQEDGYELPYLQGERVHIWEDEILPYWRRYTKLRTQLFPYIWKAAQQYQQTGLPIMRHLALIWPERQQSYGLGAERLYMFGDDVLVAPVVAEAERAREVQLPPGRWCAFWDQVKYDEASGGFHRVAGAGAVDGEQTIEVAAPLEEIPLFVRAGAELPMLPPETDTLTDIATVPGILSLQDVADRASTLKFGPNCE